MAQVRLGPCVSYALMQETEKQSIAENTLILQNLRSRAERGKVSQTVTSILTKVKKTQAFINTKGERAEKCENFWKTSTTATLHQTNRKWPLIQNCGGW